MNKQCPHHDGWERHQCTICLQEEIDALYERARERIGWGKQDDSETIETIATSFLKMIHPPYSWDYKDES